MSRVRALWRHPIKGHGRETLDTVSLTEGQTMPWDRRWAVSHEAARLDDCGWAASVNFSRGSKVASLMAISARSDEAGGTVTLRHPDLPDLTFDPDRDQRAFLEWVRPIMPSDRAQSFAIHRVEGRGMTDTDYPSVSLINLASNADLSRRAKVEVSPVRWRCNIHVDGFAPWQEFEWIGRVLRLGTAEITVREPILRCLATNANPDSGERDVDTLKALNTHFGHQDFGVYAEVTRSGRIAVGDPVEVN